MRRVRRLRRVEEPPDNEWKQRGLCREHPHEWWFPAKGNPYPPETDLAVTICRLCPVQEPCLAHAIANEETYGIWGGEKPRQRRQLAHGADIRLWCRRCGSLCPIDSLCSCGNWVQSLSRRRRYLPNA